MSRLSDLAQIYAKYIQTFGAMHPKTEAAADMLRAEQERVRQEKESEAMADVRG